MPLKVPLCRAAGHLKKGPASRLLSLDLDWVYTGRNISISCRLPQCYLHQTRTNNLQTWVAGTAKARVQLTDTMKRRALAKVTAKKRAEEIQSWHWTHPSKRGTKCWLTSSDSAGQIPKDEQWQLRQLWTILLRLSAACVQLVIKLYPIGTPSRTFAQANWCIWEFCLQLSEKGRITENSDPSNRKTKAL